MENPQRNPQRLSVLYQYHNAPEVAPAHGLEYDETVHSTCSDKYPVIHDRSYEPPRSNKVFDNDRPPRIIFGMKIRTFLLVATLMLLVVIGAAVGGAVGGKGMLENHSANGAWPTEVENGDDSENTNNNNGTNTSTSSSPPSATISATASTYSGSIPTYQPLDSCPAANDTSYTSSYARNRSSSSSSESSIDTTVNLTFHLHCDIESPIGTLSDAVKMLEAFVYSFEDCIDLCASLNFWANDADCSLAAYEAKGSRPGNCWIGKADDLKVGSLKEKDGMAIAVLGV